MADDAAFRRWWVRWAVVIAVAGSVAAAHVSRGVWPSAVEYDVVPVVVVWFALCTLPPVVVLCALVWRGPARSTVASRRCFRWGTIIALSALIPTPYFIWSIIVAPVVVVVFVLAVTDPTGGRRGDVVAGTVLALGCGVWLIGRGDEVLWEAVVAAAGLAVSGWWLIAVLRQDRRVSLRSD